MTLFKNTTKEQLLDKLQAELNEHYAAGIPSFAQERLDEEIKHMTATGSEEKFLLSWALNEAAKERGHILHGNGAAVGSMIEFLLLQEQINPLPAHYYCPSCGHFEMKSSTMFGLDLPEKNCPECGTPLKKDGFRIPVEAVWRKGGTKKPSLDYFYSAGFLPFAFKTIEMFYAERNRSVIWGGAQRDDSAQLYPSGVMVLPVGKKPENYPQFMNRLVDGTPCFFGDYYEMQQFGMEHLVLRENRFMTILQQMQMRTGVLFQDITTEQLNGISIRDMYQTTCISTEERSAIQENQTTYQDVANILTISHATFEENGERIAWQEMMKRAEFLNCPLYCREDIFDYMIAAGYSCSGASRAMEMIGFGRGAQDAYVLQDVEIPANLRKMAVNCFYLFPRSFGAQWLMATMRLAFYLKMDPDYFETVLGKSGENG